VKVLVEGFADEPADEAAGGEGEGELDHGLGGDEFAEGAFLGGCGIVRAFVVWHRTKPYHCGRRESSYARRAGYTEASGSLRKRSEERYALSQFESQFEEKFYRERQEKLKQIEALGHPVYPNQFVFTTDVPTIKAEFEPKTGEELEAEKPKVAIAGRLVAIRLQGKAGFAQLQQGGQRLQVYVRKDNVGEAGFELYKLLDLGDHVGVEGPLFRTRTGELTVHVEKLTFLAKAMLPLPDKYSGMGDIELRYRRRYLDLFTDTGDVEELAADAAPETVAKQTRVPAREVFVKRAKILRAIRRYFDERGYLEVETPMLHTVAGGAAARPFWTHHNTLDMKLALRIAPELYLKRLVVGGLDRVYEINRNFRNEGVSTRHNPEFTMLEFYQAYANYHDLMDLTEELVKSIAMQVNGTLKTEFNGVEINLGTWTKLSMREAIIRWWPNWAGTVPSLDNLATDHSTRVFAEAALENPIFAPNFNFNSTEEEVPLQQHSLLRQLLWLVAHGVDVKIGKQISEIFELLAEAHLVQPTIIYDFPLAVSPLSKVKPEEPDWVERFEFYIGGYEIGNAFSELNDPADQLRRFEDQVADKDPESMAEVDEDYVRALGYGLPPTAGEGIGIDRLTMVLTGSRSIRDVILFPLMRSQAKAEAAAEGEAEGA
jgi:lysyl-tRNA synthetase class 2